jgi:hypothetical protein
MTIRSCFAMCCLITLCQTVVLAGDPQAELRRQYTGQWEDLQFEQRVAEKRLDTAKKVAELKGTGKQAEAEDCQLEFDQWVKMETLLHDQKLQRIDLDAAVSATAGKCLTMTELVRRQELYAVWQRDKENLGHQQILEKLDLQFKRAPDAMAQEVALDSANLEHELTLNDVDLELAQAKEQLAVRTSCVPFADLRLQYALQRQAMAWKHEKATRRQTLRHNQQVASLRVLLPNALTPAQIDAENLAYEQWQAMENLTFAHRMARCNADYMILASTGRASPELCLAWTEAEARWSREEEALRHVQALAQVAQTLQQANIKFAQDPKGLEELKADQSNLLKQEEIRHKAEVGQIELILFREKGSLTMTGCPCEF